VGSLETTARRIGDTVANFPCELTVSVLPVAGQESGFVGILRDLTDRRTAEQQLVQLANFDGLTGLPNRSLFRDRLGAAMQRALRSKRQMVVMFIDLDRFKTINDSLGHEAGDKLLQHVAVALTAALRATDTLVRGHSLIDGYTVSRLGGDEFTVIAEQVDGVDDAAQIAQRIQQALQAPFHFGNEEIVVTGSMGITLYPQDDSSADDLLKHADMAMYRAKETGRNSYQFYSEEMNAAIAERLQLEGQLRHALARNEFKLVYQPKADLRTGHVTGVEVLLRWQREGEAVVMPDKFIPVLEEMGLILSVGEWVLRQAACQIRDWQAGGLPALRLAVNLSARQLRQGEIVETVIAALTETGLPAAQLELELTESMLMDGETHANTLRRLSDLGVQLAIDDFGTAYSSLSYLKRFNVDTLKIDRSFVRDTPDDPEDCAITTAVIALGRSLNLRVVAEGVETEAQMEFLRERGCDEIQGYLLSRPLAADAFVAWWHAYDTRARDTQHVLGELRGQQVGASTRRPATSHDPAGFAADHAPLTIDYAFDDR
jgi:diguanylate cyclase (GGDEF)-like protein